MKILVTSRSFGSGKNDYPAQLAALGHRVVSGWPNHDLEALTADLADTDAWIAGTGPVTAAHLDRAPGLKVIARYGVGVEAVELDAAAARGIVVTNTPGANSGAVADHTVALLLAAARQVAEGDRRVRRGDWRPIRGRELGAMTIGIWGFGRIGQGVARRLSGFGPRVVACDPYLDLQRAESLGVEPGSPEDLAGCDAVSLNAPGGSALVTREWLQGVRPGMFLVNSARADLVDEVALAEALGSGLIAGYAADSVAGDTAGHDSPLLADDLAPRVTITPHVGAQTVEAIDEMGRLAVENALAVLDGHQPPNAVGWGR
ncbi:MAG: hydroxyacid dehydrogenase [Propionibacteriaceae bacterium]|nr:hydroxyacid dehydrogenase [Propionibacteriaceae bacterium]